MFDYIQDAGLISDTLEDYHYDVESTIEFIMQMDQAEPQPCGKDLMKISQSLHSRSLPSNQANFKPIRVNYSHTLSFNDP